ncbi:OmpP1/FadL family transporter [Mangrovibacterium sp.]|uniref:OmpP1/FadL family transporter n=1 Tax=Mangrovibacterium sp. TaxID=1961364 RepID=UPI0035677205
MKRIILSSVIVLSALCSAHAGGILTNGNQSAQYIRMLSRNASTQIDGVYFNPAGLVQMSNGFHFALNNQSLFQTRTIENNFPLLNQSSYEGGLTIPVFPTAFAVYKKDKLALSFGFGINSGGGSAEYNTGLPSFEMPFALLPSGLNQLGVAVTGYSTDLYFKGYSAYLGFQFNASYKISEAISGSAGFRLINANNKYEGHIKNISVFTAGQSFLAADLLADLATQATTAAQSFSQYPEDMVMPDAVATSAGLPTGTTFGQAVTVMTTNAATADAYASQMGDKIVDAKQKGFGFTPIIGLNIRPSDKLNVGLRYEFRTKLELENQTEVDDLGQFPDGDKYRNDIPAILAAGGDFQLYDNLKLSASYTNYFDKNANWDGKENEVDKNLYELAFGMEYAISDFTTASAGFMHTKTGVGRGFQSDLSNSLTGNSVGFGIMFKVNEKVDLDLGVLYTAYESDYIEDTYQGIAYKESYDKTSLAFAIGVTYHLFK